jgi:hypothetical protein
LPDRLWPLIAGLLGLSIAVMALALWATFGGTAGKQRGLVLRNLVSEPVVVKFEDSQQLQIASNAPGTFVLDRENFPQTVTAVTLKGEIVAEQEFEYSDFAEAEFRYDVDRAGFFPTSESRTVTP